MRAAVRLRGLIQRTPLVGSTQIDQGRLHFKCENFQLSGSFKARGAFAKLTALADAGDHSGAITASSGNHGVASGIAARRLGRPLTVVLPTNVSPAKLARIRNIGVETILHGGESGAAETFARAEGTGRGLVYISPYNDPDVIAGQGTIGVELLEDLSRFDTVFVAMGGGGLISGIGAVLKAFRPTARVIGCAARNSMALAAAMRAGRVVEVPHIETLADGVAGDMDEDAITLPLARAVIDDVVICDEQEIAASMARLAVEERQFVEGSAALALAGYLRLRETSDLGVSVVILCGGNFDIPQLVKTILRARN
jgi:threonine dehydratase